MEKHIYLYDNEELIVKYNNVSMSSDNSLCT